MGSSAATVARPSRHCPNSEGGEWRSQGAALCLMVNRRPRTSYRGCAAGRLYPRRGTYRPFLRRHHSPKLRPSARESDRIEARLVGKGSVEPMGGPEIRSSVRSLATHRGSFPVGLAQRCAHLAGGRAAHRKLWWQGKGSFEFLTAHQCSVGRSLRHHESK